MGLLRQLPESHFINRVGWLRAAVLGANDGILSTASLIVGVAAAAATQHDVLIAGVAGLVAGAMSFSKLLAEFENHSGRFLTVLSEHWRNMPCLGGAVTVIGE